MGVFSKDQGGKKTLKRNTYPVSRQINTTFNFGQLIPFSVREINPGESVKIRPSVGLRFMPTYFPVQNKMKCYIHYFYVRSRNLYKDFKQFYEDNSPSTSHPYLGFPSSLVSSRAKMFSVGGLADHMGVAVTRHVSDGELAFSRPLTVSPSRGTQLFRIPFRFSNHGNSPILDDGEEPVLSNLSDNIPYNTVPVGGMKYTGVSYGTCILLSDSISKNVLSGFYRFDLSALDLGPIAEDFSTYNYNYFLSFGVLDYTNKSFTPISFSKAASIPSSLLTGRKTVSPALSIDTTNKILEEFPAGSFFSVFFGFVPSTDSDNFTAGEKTRSSVSSIDFYYGKTTSVSVSDQLSSFNPFSEELNAESFTPLNSMPFRAYEQIYNAFYRDERNNPLMKDGKPVYDEFLLNTDGGRDNFDYKIHFRNWEQDAYTTALPTPQQGIAPLVGISSTGVATFQDLESGKQYTVKSVTDDTGDKVVNAEFTEDSLKDMNSDWKPSVARALVHYATSGISINDFRNVNALQRFKELNLRRGRKYKDLMEARFGVNISYAEMNMPEFIGGASFDVQPVQVNQTVNQGSKDPLGSYAGQLFASGGSKHSITKFCDEHGYVIGIISVVPTPVYETVTPKFFFKHTLLDFWQPEFNHIGLQPIPMKELDVFGQYSKSPDNMDEEFGYQRPWYDYISALDSVHGQFRTSLSSFVMYRSWSEPPTLSPDFLLVDPSSGIDDVFSVRTDSEGNSVDKILGQIYEDYTIKSPVSKFGIAKLE